jgi:hypothetical protein
MAQYVFTCCNRTATVPDDSAPSVQLPHLCTGDVPCVGTAVSTTLTNLQALAAGDVSTVVVDPVTGTADGTDGSTGGAL